MLNEYDSGLLRGRLQTAGLFLMVAALLYIGTIGKKPKPPQPSELETKMGYLSIVNDDLNGDGSRDWSFEIYNMQGKQIFRKSFLQRPGLGRVYIDVDEPNIPYNGDPNETFEKPGIRDNAV